uniref:Uncharacterized protein n=1 Tax=Chlamydomonas leiostraca TaxID=1034604 RepID=A0A7S0R630_9CHLO|mmetsp:Transcript_14799/g.36942  ORF Transcript_14799/g.36942 Transcript_14799/m.36942 type:complete len:520 (+) Transcript_14799:29-1588(+)
MCVEAFTCIFLPIINLIACIKGLIVGAIASVFLGIVFLGISIALLPLDIWHSYWAVSVTKMLGPNLRALALFMLPVPLLCWPICALVFGLGYGIFIGGMVMGAHCGSRCNTPCGYLPETLAQLGTSFLKAFVGGLDKAPKEVAGGIKDFAHFNAHSFFKHVLLLREHPGPPVDISPLRLVLSLPVAMVGLLIGLVGGVLQFPKFPLVVVVGWIEMWDAFLEAADSAGACGCVIFSTSLLPFMVVGTLLWPAIVVALAAFLPVNMLVVCFMAAGMDGYKEARMGDGFYKGTATAWNIMHSTEGFIHEFSKHHFGDCAPHCFSLKLPDTRDELLQKRAARDRAAGGPYNPPPKKTSLTDPEISGSNPGDAPTQVGAPGRSRSFDCNPPALPPNAAGVNTGDNESQVAGAGDVGIPVGIPVAYPVAASDVEAGAGTGVSDEASRQLLTDLHDPPAGTPPAAAAAHMEEAGAGPAAGEAVDAGAEAARHDGADSGQVKVVVVETAGGDVDGSGKAGVQRVKSM